MPCQVGNDAARDSQKHSLAYVIRSAVLELVPTSGPLLSVHYDKRGAKMTIQYVGNDCAELKTKVEDLSNSICQRNVALDQIKLLPEDSEGLKSFTVSANTGELGGVTIKKFTVNAGKEQIVLEFNVGASKKESDAANKAVEKPAVAQAKDSNKESKAKSATTNVAKPFAYDSVPQVSAQLTQEVLELLKAEGIQLNGKEDVLKAKLSDKLETPLTLLKNTAYTRGFKANISQPVSNFVVRR